MKFKRLMVIGSTVLCLGLVACNNSNEVKEEISLSDAKKYAKSNSEYAKYDYSSIKVTSTIKEANATGTMGGLLGSSLKNFIGVSQTQTFSYKDYYSNYVLSTEALNVYESTSIKDFKILSYKIYKTGNKISIESTVEHSMSMEYEGFSYWYKMSSTTINNYNEEGFVTSSSTESSSTFVDNSTLTQKIEGTVELVK